MSAIYGEQFTVNLVTIFFDSDKVVGIIGVQIYAIAFDDYWLKGSVVDLELMGSNFPFLNYTKYHVGLWFFCRKKVSTINGKIISKCLRLNVLQNGGHLKAKFLGFSPKFRG